MAPCPPACWTAARDAARPPALTSTRTRCAPSAARRAAAARPIPPAAPVTTITLSAKRCSTAVTISAPQQKRHAGGEQDGEDDPAEADRVDPVEQAHPGEETNDRGEGEHAGEAPDLSREEAGPPVAHQDHELIHHEKGLQIGLDGPRAPSLGGHVDDGGRARRSHCAADRAGEHARGEAPAAPGQPS